jgi:type I restriction enzyme R subunit
MKGFAAGVSLTLVCIIGGGTPTSPEAFYDALEVNDSAVKVLGDETLKTIARELVATVQKNTTIDWTVRENVRAHLRVLVKRILRKYGYPPDKQEKATLTVLEQAEVLSASWASA